MATGERIVSALHQSHVTVLMYHAVQPVDQHDAGADPHYSVTTQTLRAQLALIAQHRHRACSVASALDDGFPSISHDLDRPRVCLTFDDGHASNAHAAALIARAGGTADFFVNPTTIGTPNFLTWGDLREMAALGMSIQSHSMHHRYLDELSATQVIAELRDSKHAIEDRLGQPVILLAPPGGRMAPGMIKTAQSLGYAAVCSSRAGVWDRHGGAREIPRMAVLATTGPRQMHAWITQDRMALLKGRVRHGLLGVAKQVLGNARYERLRARLLGGGSP